MATYIGSDGKEVDVKTLNSFRLVNGLIKCSQQMFASNNEDGVAVMNVNVLKDELLERLDTRTPEEKAGA